MELNRIKILVDKYLNGATSHQEEEQLARYFAEHQNITEELKPLKAMFASFEILSNTTAPQQAPKNTASLKRGWLGISYKWIAGVTAACVMICAGILFNKGYNNTQYTPTTEADFVCHINGVRVNDTQIAYAEADRILASVTQDLQLAMMEVNRLTNYSIIK